MTALLIEPMFFLNKKTVKKSRWSTDDDSLTQNFISIKLASSQVIKSWSLTRFSNGVRIGYVTSAETIHYKTLKPVFDGLFCERIFGPVKDWQCHCGVVKYFRAPKIETWCPTCWVQITRSQKRRYKLGTIFLGAPILHIWYKRANRAINPLYRLLFFLNKDILEILEGSRVIVSQSCVITPCTLSGFSFSEFEWNLILGYFKSTNQNTWFDSDQVAPWKKECIMNSRPVQFDEFLYVSNKSNYALYTLLKRINLHEFARYATKRIEILRSMGFLYKKAHIVHYLAYHNIGKPEKIEEVFRRVQKETRRTFRLRHTFLSGLTLARDSYLKKTRPEWIFFSYLPVLPPDLRPILKLEENVLASSDVNDLYRFLIYRATRLQGFVKSQISNQFVLLREMGLVQASVNSILDNTSLKFPLKRSVMYEVYEPLQSLSDRIVGKTGRFRQNILGKRVDYSGRSVIIVGPTLRLWECGLPKEIAFVLFKPLLVYEILRSGLVTNMICAKLFVKKYPITTLQILRRIITFHPVLLNRAPTLHRMGIQAFLPKLVNGRAIQLHPFVCTAFNADFDGDQMAVHIPLSIESIIEARLLLLAPFNWLSPATGEPSLLPSQDIVLGIYYLTLAKKSKLSQSENYSSMHSLLWITESKGSLLGQEYERKIDFCEYDTPYLSLVTPAGHSYTLYSSSISVAGTFGDFLEHSFVTTVGRALFHKYLPSNSV
jgi:DNA-directed RNA polymerase subunit beta'